MPNDHPRRGEHERHAHAGPTSGHAFDGIVSFIELEGEVLSGFVTEAMACLARTCRDEFVDVRLIVDLGSGPGVASTLLAKAFPSATVTAADNSPAMLARSAARARRNGVGDRVDTRLIDFDDELALGDVDVVWASMSLHHARDEAAVLDDVRAALEPNGLLCIIERGDTPSIRSTDELGRPGLWNRLHDAWASWFGANVLGQTFGMTSCRSRLRSSGYEIVTDTTLEVTVDRPLTGESKRFVRHLLERRLKALDGHADTDDLGAVAGWLADPDPRRAWATASYREKRQLYIAKPHT